MNFSSEDIKELRDKSGAGMMDCKKALDESNGDVNKAVEWLRKKGINTAQKKSSRSASDGLVTVNINEEAGVILEVNAETDFVARNENFQKFCNDLASTCLEHNEDNIEKLLELKFFSEEIVVKQKLTEIISKLGENIVIKRIKIFKKENYLLQKYLHNSINDNSGKIGVLLSLQADEKNDLVDNFSKNICMHIAATDPKSKNVDDLDKTLVDKERIIYYEQLKSSNKPKDIIEKIIDGKIKKYYEEVCLNEQFFVMDNKVKIKDCISTFNKENNLNFKVIDFIIYKLGQE